MKCYELYPGLCININDYKYQFVDTSTFSGYTCEKIILETQDGPVPVIRQYRKTNTSPIYLVTPNQEYLDYYFMIQQVSVGYQAFDLTPESGMIQYDYPQKIVQPSKNIKINLTKEEIYKMYPSDYQIVTDYTLESFIKYFQEKRQIIVPKIRLNNMILVQQMKEQKELRQEQQNKEQQAQSQQIQPTQQHYENLYWLIQLQQQFINDQVDRPEKSKFLSSTKSEKYDKVNGGENQPQKKTKRTKKTEIVETVETLGATETTKPKSKPKPKTKKIMESKEIKEIEEIEKPEPEPKPDQQNQTESD